VRARATKAHGTHGTARGVLVITTAVLPLRGARGGVFSRFGPAAATTSLTTSPTGLAQADNQARDAPFVSNLGDFPVSPRDEQQSLGHGEARLRCPAGQVVKERHPQPRDGRQEELSFHRGAYRTGGQISRTILGNEKRSRGTSRRIQRHTTELSLEWEKELELGNVSPEIRGSSPGVSAGSDTEAVIVGWAPPTDLEYDGGSCRLYERLLSSST
jgi:hypothetical protein